jgi:hypothetical protein
MNYNIAAIQVKQVLSNVRRIVAVHNIKFELHEHPSLGLMSSWGRETNCLWEFGDLYDTAIEKKQKEIQIWIYDKVTSYSIGYITIAIVPIESEGYPQPILMLYTVNEKSEFDRLRNITTALIIAKTEGNTQQYFTLETDPKEASIAVLPKFFSNVFRFSGWQIMLMVLNTANLYASTFDNEYGWATVWAALSVWNYFRYSDELEDEEVFF